MPVAKLSTSGTRNTMKSEEGNDSLDTFIRQAIGKEPLLPFSRTGDNPVQWIQLLHALDQPDLPGWPLMNPIKIQMQKCGKCSREFCSPINYRRHSRVHRRSLNVDKESHKHRDILAAFWDKLSLEEAKEVVSFNDATLKKIPGSSLVKALTYSLRKPGVWTLPQVYVKAGSTLLDIIQAKPSRLPISSQELFSILDDASERTFLCAGTAEAVERYVFDGEAANNSLELKNLVASTSLLFEQQLVKAWIANKDAEALRWQRLLVEEEEAAQKRQAELLERKKQKKLRQKEQKVKEQLYDREGDLNVAVDAADTPVLAEASGPSSSSDSSSNSGDVPTNLDSFLESTHFQSKASERDIEARIDLGSECNNQGESQTIEPHTGDENAHQHLTTNHWQFLKSQRGGRHGVHSSQNLHNQKTGPSKVWTKKNKVENDGESSKPLLPGESSHQIEENKCVVVIGSISITVKRRAAPHAQDTCRAQPANTSEKLNKPDTVQSRMNHKLWRPVSRGETKGLSPVERGNEDSEVAVVLENAHDRITSSERCVPSQSADVDNTDNLEQHDPLSDANALPGNDVPFTTAAAKEFLAERWKEAISGDHVKLVLSSGSGPPAGSDIQHNNSTASNASDPQERNVLGRGAQVKFRSKPEKSLKIKYIPKPKAAA